jgi:RNA ligase
VPTKLSDILDLKELYRLVDDGYIRQRFHDTLPLGVLNYAEKAVYENLWTPETRACRGLIVDADSNIVARPFPKFFNESQHEMMGDAASIPWDDPFYCFEKVDGSLGILYPTDLDGFGGERAISTRGSFTSDQAIHATKVWNERYTTCRSCPGWTFLFEICYPANRICLNYGDRDDLILLGAVNISTGLSVSPNEAAHLLSWVGPMAKEFDPERYHCMEQEDSEDEEGFVLWFPKSEFRLKAKYTTYLRLHTLMTKTSSKTIWRALMEGREDELKKLPDELHPFATKMADSLKRDFSVIYESAKYLARMADQIDTRKDQARMIMFLAPNRTISGTAFALLDGKDPSANIWKAIEPEYTAPFGNLEAE